MADDNLAYHDASGAELDTSTEGGVRAVLADIGRRLMALETEPRAAAGASADGGRLERLETIVLPFFREAALDFDNAHAKQADTGTAQPVAGPASAGT